MQYAHCLHAGFITGKKFECLMLDVSEKAKDIKKKLWGMLRGKLN